MADNIYKVSPSSSGSGPTLEQVLLRMSEWMLTTSAQMAAIVTALERIEAHVAPAVDRRTAEERARDATERLRRGH